MLCCLSLKIAAFSSVHALLRIGLVFGYNVYPLSYSWLVIGCFIVLGCYLSVSAFGSCQEGLRFYSRLVCQNQRSCLSNETISWRVDSHHLWLAPTALDWGLNRPNQATVPLSLKLKLTMLSSKSWSPPPFRSSRPITPDPNTRKWLRLSLLAERKEKKVSPVWATVA